MLDTAEKRKAEIILCPLQLKVPIRTQKWVLEGAKYAFQIALYYR